MGEYRYLGAVARIPCTTHDRHQALTDLRDLQLEQLHHEFRSGAADEQLRPAWLRAHVIQVAAHTVAGTQHITRNAFVLGDDRLGVATQVDIDVAALDTLDDAGNQLADAIFPGVDDLCALGVAYPLHDDLLRGLCSDAAE